MRGLFTTGLLVAPALASAFTLPDFWPVGEHHEVKPGNHNDAASRTIHLTTGGGSHDTTEDVLTFNVDVLASAQLCGFGNITVNGQELEQGSRGDGSSGKGSITDGRKIISASWDFDCLKGLAKVPSAQFMKFSIDSVDGNDVEDLSFSIMFRQAPVPEIVMISPDLAIESPVENTPAFPKISDEDEDENEEPMDFESYDLEGEVAELNELKALVQELEYRIYEKEEEISSVIAAQEFDAIIGECDSLKCLLKVCLAKAHKVAHKIKYKVYSLASHKEMKEGRIGHHWRKPHWKKPPPWKKPHFHFPGKHGNHSHHNKTCHHPHHNGSHPHPHPPPHWRKPHFKLPPRFCHPPPPPHHGPPHGKPPHRKPPHHEPGHHEDPPHDDPTHDDPPHGSPPHDDLIKGDSESLDRHQRPDNHPLVFDDKVSFFRYKDNGPVLPHHPDGPLPHRRRTHRLQALHALKFVIAGVLISVLIAAIHRRCCTPARRQAKSARREERHRRRAYRRAAYKQAWKSWIQRHFRYRLEADEYEEKYGSFVSRDDEDEVASTIAELRSAASIVSDIVAAEEGRAGRMSMESRSTSLPEYRSELGEELPAYEDSDGSEESSMVADGFRYTPGTSENTPGLSPSVSEAGSVRSILGDTKE